MLPYIPVISNTQIPLTSIVITQENPWQPTKSSNQPKPEQVTVEEGMTLTSIAVTHNTTIQRLYNKNLNIDNPDLINVEQVLVIPLSDEQLADRPLTPQIATVSPQIGSQAGNSYTPGYCTYFAKQMRPDLPNNLGNANTWYINAAAQGFAVGYTPRVGAVAAAIDYMHVAIVTAVSGNTVTVSEMNYVAFNTVSSRTAPISEFRYIY